MFQICGLNDSLNYCGFYYNEEIYLVFWLMKLRYIKIEDIMQAGIKIKGAQTDKVKGTETVL